MMQSNKQWERMKESEQAIDSRRLKETLTVHWVLQEI